MSAENITFTGAIRETARATGRVASAADVERLNLAAQSLGRLDHEAGAVVFDLDDGGVEDSAAWMGREVARLPKAAERVTPGPTFTGQTAVAQALAERIRRQDQADALAHAQALAKGANPWQAGSVNLTRQAIIKKQLPHVAVQLQAQARK